MERVIIIILDACGVGELPDASAYGDQGASTIPNLSRSVGGLRLPTCQKLGLGNIVPIEGVAPDAQPLGSYGKMAEKSPGKDSTTGHWEIAGVVLDKPFPVFSDGFPDAVVREFEQRAGVKTIGNFAASGTEIIKRLGEEHLRTGAVILYTSADSVFQLAAHEDLYPLPRLYEICRIAREMLIGDYHVGRVIARPFVGKPGSFVRTSGRKDFSRVPPHDTLLDTLKKHDKPVLSIGKIYDLFAGCGINKAIKTANNAEVMAAVSDAVVSDREHKLIFANCVDFDQLWGHRNDEANFAKALEDFDHDLNRLLPQLGDSDCLIITADHGCDPTQKHSTDHSREYVPLLAYGKQLANGSNLGTRSTFADLGATVAELLSVPALPHGLSFAPLLRKG
ncbi:MAG: phosphopentomutase [Candidatus Zixiibacteriota bacterium]